MDKYPGQIALAQDGYPVQRDKLYITYAGWPYQWLVLDENEECLLTDFSQSIGDTLDWSRQNSDYGDIRSQDSLIFGDYKLYVQNIYMNSNYFLGSIIDGIGGSNGLVFDYGTSVKYHCADFDYVP